MGGNIPGGNFLGGNFTGGCFPDTVKDMCSKELKIKWILFSDRIFIYLGLGSCLDKK